VVTILELSKSLNVTPYEAMLEYVGMEIEH